MAANLQDLYRKNFNPDLFIEEYYPNIIPRLKFFMKKIYLLFSEGKLSGRRALDFGTGPMINLMAIASKFCEEVTGCEFLDQNREHVKLFMKNDPQALQRNPYLDVLSQIEGFSNVEEGGKVIAARLRNKFQDIVPCDATKDYPLGKPVEPFDLLLTRCVLESATVTHEDYINAVKNMVTLVKPKGKIVVLGINNCTWYFVAGTKFPVCNLNEDLVKKAFSLAGCTADLYLLCQDDEFMSNDCLDSKDFFMALFTKI